MVSASPATGTATKVDAEAVWKDERECIVGTYGRGDTPVFTHGLGCKMWDSEGNEYLAGRNPLGGPALFDRTVLAYSHAHALAVAASSSLARPLVPVLPSLERLRGTTWDACQHQAGMGNMPVPVVVSGTTEPQRPQL